ncbi:MAG: hypothetical protein PF450_16735 [Bacteroidales bacterium]|nr:hypothetical protein [Bacteroidales bacterium]
MLEAGPSWDIVRVSDPGHMFEQSNLYGTSLGVALWQEIIENLSIGTGAYYHNYSSGINPIDQRPHQVAIPNLSTLLIPGRISYRMQLSDFPISITPLLGYQYGIIFSSSALQSRSSLIRNQQGSSISYSLTESPLISDRLHLLEAGMTIDYRFKNNWQLSLAISHFSGLKDVSYSNLVYSVDLDAEYSAEYSNDGSKIQTGLSLYAPISNIWENKRLRLHRKIEHSSNRASATKNLRYIYFGGDFGALWRSFSTTNPAIGPIPIDNKGVFRYSNLHTGAYIGYMFNSTTGVDLGAHFQRSSNHFSVMYDHEVYFADKIRAPFFLEVPVMFRHYFDLHNEKLFLMPTMGISVMTHFSGEEYNSGGANFDYADNTHNMNYSASRVSRFGYTVKAGVGLEYKIPIKRALHATCNVTYSHGLRPIDLLEISTSLNETPSNSQIEYKGSGWKASIGLRMPILLGKDNRKCGAVPVKR